jgi:hypothetical protein
LRFIAEFKLDKSERGCALVNAAVELPDPNHPARRVVFDGVTLPPWTSYPVGERAIKQVIALEEKLFADAEAMSKTVTAVAATRKAMASEAARAAPPGSHSR